MRGTPLAVAALGVTLLALNLGVFGLLRLLTHQQEQYLGEYLELVGRAIAEPPRDYFWILEVVADPATGEVYEDAFQAYRDSLDWRNLEDSLSGALREGLIREASLVSRAGYVLIVARQEEGANEGLLPLDRLPSGELPAVQEAWHGDFTTPDERPGPAVAERLYFPLRDEGGQTLAVIRLDVHPDSYTALHELHNRLVFGFLAGSAVLVALWILTARAIRRSIHAERAASQADRLRALGTLTAGLAHEIRNPLGIIQLQIEELREALAKPGDPKLKELIRENIQGLQDETRRIRNLTGRFLQFSRRSSEEEDPAPELDAAQVTAQIVRMWSKGLNPERRKVEVTNQAHGALHVRFPQDRLTQILINLLRNADEAIGERQGRIRVSLAQRAGAVEIAVADDGPGIDAPTLRRIFDPFFTTRPEGTGLGLSLSRTYAEAYGGSLEADSAPGSGSVFTLRLPSAR